MRLFGMMLLLSGFLMTSCAVYTRPAPPPSRAELRGSRPCAKADWVSGHWRWEGKRIGYRWVPGHWRC